MPSYIPVKGCLLQASSSHLHVSIVRVISATVSLRLEALVCVCVFVRECVCSKIRHPQASSADTSQYYGIIVLLPHYFQHGPSEQDALFLGSYWVCAEKRETVDNTYGGVFAPDRGEQTCPKNSRFFDFKDHVGFDEHIYWNECQADQQHQQECRTSLRLCPCSHLDFYFYQHGPLSLFSCSCWLIYVHQVRG